MKKDMSPKKPSNKATLAAVTKEMNKPRTTNSVREHEDNQKAPVAATKALHGLANYRRFSENVKSEIMRSELTTRAFAILVFDLNGMKQIDTSYDHLAANRALCRLTDIFRSSCRSIDTASRYSGDEFAIILPETDTNGAKVVGRRICEELRTDREEPLLSLCFGIAVYPEDGTTIETLLQPKDRVVFNMKD